MADKEMQQFQDDLMQSVREMNARRSGATTAGRSTVVQVAAAVHARNRVGLSQSAFADLMGVSVRTLQDWEQGRRTPSKAAQTLLRVALMHPEALRDLQAV